MKKHYSAITSLKFFCCGSILATLCILLPRDTTAASFSWPMYLPAIVSSDANAPVWGAMNYVCCTGGPFTFTVTGEEGTKSSTRNDCNAEQGTWEGPLSSSTGVKSFSWSATGGGCQYYSGTISHTFKRGISYLIRAQWSGSGVAVDILEFNNRAADSDAESKK